MGLLGGKKSKQIVGLDIGSSCIKAVELKATKAGYEVRPSANRDGVMLETTIAVDEDSFEPYTQQMQAWADEFGCEYDGWECKVVNQ